MLAAQAGECILDVGCGTGHLTAEIGRRGARVLGVDRSASMIAQARANCPELEFEVSDACSLRYEAQFDGVFSNAVLHWVKPPQAAAAAIARALRPGGRLVCEFGGRGNVQTLEEAAYAALRRLGMAEPERFNPWYYPGIAEYAGILEGCGMEVTFAHLFDRPTRLEHGERGLENWFRMFGGRLLEPLDEASHAEFFRLVEEHAAPRLKRDGHWTADYRRLRIAGRKPA